MLLLALAGVGVSFCLYWYMPVQSWSPRHVGKASRPTRGGQKRKKRGAISMPIPCHAITPRRFSPRSGRDAARLGLSRPAQTAIVDDGIVGQHGHDAPAQPLVAHAADPLVADDHAAVLAALAAGHAVAEAQQRLGRHDAGLSQAPLDPALVHHAVGRPHPPAEVRLELGDGERVRDQLQRRRGRQPRAVLGEEVQRRREVGRVRRRRRQVQRQQGMVDGRRCAFRVVGLRRLRVRLPRRGRRRVLRLVDAIAVSRRPGSVRAS